MTCTLAAADGISGRRDRARERLALTGGHLDDVAGQHPQRGLQLHVERSQGWSSGGCLAGDRQELRDVGGVGEVVQLQQLGGLE